MRIAFLSTVAVATLSLSVAALGQSPQSPPSGGGGAAERSQSGSGSGGASGQSQGSQQRSGPSGGGDQQRSGQSTTGADQQRSGQSTSGTSSGQNQQGSQQRSGQSGGGDQQRSGQSTTGGDQWWRPAAFGAEHHWWRPAALRSEHERHLRRQRHWRGLVVLVLVGDKRQHQQRTADSDHADPLDPHFERPEGDPLATARGPRGRWRDAAPHRCPVSNSAKADRQHHSTISWVPVHHRRG